MVVRQQPDKSDFLPLLEAKWDDFRLRTVQRPATSLILLNFSLAVWQARYQFLGEYSADTPLRAAFSIAAIFKKSYRTIIAKKLCKRRDRENERQKFYRSIILWLRIPLELSPMDLALRMAPRVLATRSA